MNKPILTLLLLLLAIATAACTVPPGQTGGQPVPGQPYLSPTPPQPGAEAAAAGVEAGVAWATAEAARTQAQLAAQRATAESQMATAASAAATAQVETQLRGTMQAQSATATTAAGTATAVYVATADTLAFRATDVAINATATAVSAQAAAEQRLIDDEMQRLALQREAEAAALEYQRRLNQLKPILWGALALAAVLTAAGVLWFLARRAQPVVIPDPVYGPRVLVPAGSYQVLPSPQPRLALPAPQPQREEPVRDDTPTSHIQPLPPLTSGHVLIAGETGSGKSTAMLAVLARRGQVVVLDPHDDGRTWNGARVIGGGRDFDAIGGFMAQMEGLLSDRYHQRARGQRDFPPLTVATDEMPAIVSALGRSMEDVWRSWLREGRKVGLFFVVSTQSTRVKTLGIRGEGDLLENFTYVLLLGKVAAAEFPDLVAGQPRPAVLRAGASARPVMVPFQGNPYPGVPHQGNQGGPYPGASQQGGPYQGNPYQEVAHQDDDTVLLPDGQVMRLESGGQAGERFVAPAPQYADPTQLTPQVVARIQQLRAAGHSQRAIETAVFGYTGGAAYLAVREVLY